MASLAELANVKSLSAPSAISPAAAARLAATSPINLTVALQGQRVVTEEFLIYAAALDPLTQIMVEFFGEVLAETAKEFHTPNIDTRATYDSISAGPEPGGGPVTTKIGIGAYSIDVGAFTPYAPFLEFGFVHWLSGEFIRNPFLIPAADATAPSFQSAMEQIVGILSGSVGAFGGEAIGAVKAQGVLTAIRGSLYSISRFIGDIQVFGFRGFAGARGPILKSAQVLGDVSSGMRGAIGHRIIRRVGGRFSSGGLVSSINARLAGPGATSVASSNRIYNRISGRGLGQVLKGL